MRWSVFVAVVISAALNQAAPARAEQVTWMFNNTSCVGGYPVHVEGNPVLVDSPVGKALQFDGLDDTVLIDGRPLADVGQFTVEVVFRPEGGQFEQRFMHIAETDPESGKNVRLTGSSDSNPRLMFEVRVTDQGWYLDTFVNSRSGSKPLIFPDKIYPLGRWYAAAQTYDGTTYRAYVNGALQGESIVPFFPHGPGRVRLGARMNKVDFFKGSIAQARFSDRALLASELIRIAED